MNGEVVAEMGNFRLLIVPDETPLDPRKEFDHLTTMVCFHRRYNLGDVHNYSSETLVEELAEEHPQGVYHMPLYLMDHSGLALSTSSSLFRACDSAGWDWGQLGIIFIPKGAVCAEWGEMSEDEEAKKAEEIMVSEVNEYDQYLRGDIWGYVVEKKCGECGTWVYVNSCYGYYGQDDCIDEGKRSLEYYAKQDGDGE